MQSVKTGSFSSKIGTLVALSVLALPLALTRPASAQNLVVNGGFEDPIVPGGDWSVFGSIPGWDTFFGPGIEIQNNVAGSPAEGNQHVELDSHANSGMFQNIPTTGGQQYLLSFAYSPRPGVGADSNWISVLWDGSFFTSVTGAGGGGTVWNYHQFVVTGNPGFTTLAFQAFGTNDSLGGYIDDVSVTKLGHAAAVPEPGTMTLLGTGAFGLVAKLRRRRQTEPTEA
jgi:hypothetical protein